jgi:hypothetical protein
LTNQNEIDYLVLGSRVGRDTAGFRSTEDNFYHFAQNSLVWRSLTAAQQSDFDDWYNSIRGAGDPTGMSPRSPYEPLEPSTADALAAAGQLAESADAGAILTPDVLSSTFDERLASELEQLGRGAEASRYFGADATRSGVERFFTRDSQNVETEEIRSAFIWFYYVHYVKDRRTTAPGALAIENYLNEAQVSAYAQYIVNSTIRGILINAIREELGRALREGADPDVGDAGINVEDIGDVVDLETGTLTEEAAQNVENAALRRSRESRVTEGEASTPAEEGRLKRLAEQCFLIDYLPEFAIKNQMTNYDYNNEFLMVHGKTDTLVGKIQYNPSAQFMNSFTPAQLSSLVPKLRLYKVFNQILEGQRGPEYEQEVPFYDHVRGVDLDEMLTATVNRGRAAGIKSFDWTMDGQNPFTARRDIFAELKLYFQSMDDFLRTFNVKATVSGGSMVDKSFRYVDLINIDLVPEIEVDAGDAAWNPDYYKLKAEVGWVHPGDSDQILTPNQKEAIKESTMVLFLSAYEHELNVNAEGNVEVTISYTAWSEASFLDSSADILADGQTRIRRLQTKKFIEQRAKAGCSADYMAELRAAYDKIVKDEVYRGWRRLLSELYCRGRVFYIPIAAGDLEDYVTTRERTTSRPFTSLLRARSGRRDTHSRVTSANLENQSATYLNTLRQSIPDDFDGDPDKLWENVASLTYDSEGEDRDEDVNVQFFYLGDLIEVALRLVNRSIPASETGGLQNQGNTASVGKIDQDLRLVTGPIQYVLNHIVAPDPDVPEGIALPAGSTTAESKIIYDINLADIPVSVNYFIDWFLEMAISQDREIYPVLTFVRDLANHLLSNMMRQECYRVNNTADQSLQLRTSIFSAAASPNNKDVLIEERNAPLGIGPRRDSSRLDVDHWYEENAKKPESTRRRLLRPPGQGERAFHYMMIYSLNAGALESLDGDQGSDALRGIYHFNIGRDVGIFKDIKFTKSDLAGLRESRFARNFADQVTGLSILSNLYEVTIRCFGTTMFIPGMKIYVDPVGIAPELGRPGDRTSPAHILGFGGYYVVVKVESYVESGKYETVLTAIPERAGTPDQMEDNTGEVSSGGQRTTSTEGCMRQINAESLIRSVYDGESAAILTSAGEGAAPPVHGADARTVGQPEDQPGATMTITVTPGTM